MGIVESQDKRKRFVFVGVLGAFVRSANLEQSAKEMIYKYNNIDNNLFLLGLGTGIK